MKKKTKKPEDLVFIKYEDELKGKQWVGSTEEKSFEEKNPYKKVAELLAKERDEMINENKVLRSLILEGLKR